MCPLYFDIFLERSYNFFYQIKFTNVMIMANVQELATIIIFYVFEKFYPALQEKCDSLSGDLGDAVISLADKGEHSEHPQTM